MKEFWAELLPWALGVIFIAGGLVTGFRIGLRQLRKDLNGAMTRNRGDHREISDELHNALLALMVIFEERKDRELLFQALKR